MITAVPDYDNLKGIVDRSNFFEHSQYDDLMRNLIMWLVKKEKEIIIKDFSIKKKKSGQWEIKADLESSREKLKKATVEIYGNDPLIQAAGRTPDFSSVVLRENLEVKGSRLKFGFRLPVELQVLPEYLYKVVLTVQYGRDIDRDMKNMRMDPYEPIVHRRDAIIEAKNTTFVQIENLEHEYVFMPGQNLRFEIKCSPPRVEKTRH